MKRPTPKHIMRLQRTERQKDDTKRFLPSRGQGKQLIYKRTGPICQHWKLKDSKGVSSKLRQLVLTTIQMHRQNKDIFKECNSHTCSRILTNWYAILDSNRGKSRPVTNMWHSLQKYWRKKSSQEQQDLQTHLTIWKRIVRWG